MISSSFPSLLQSFFTDRLLRQRQASPHTIAGYRDCFRLLLQFAKKRLSKMPSQIRIEDLDAPFLGLFLDHLESTRKNSARTRNVRLGALHSFFRYVALEEPAHALHCQRILAVPNKRHVRRPIEFLNREEIDALLAVPNRSTWVGRRDRTLLLVAVQTGLRVSELIGLTCQDVVLGTGAHVRCLGKGRKPFQDFRCGLNSRRARGRKSSCEPSAGNRGCRFRAAYPHRPGSKPKLRSSSFQKCGLCANIGAV